VTDWLELLLGSVLGGAALVWAMVLPRRFAVLAALAAAVPGVTALGAVRSVGAHYQTAEAIGAAVFFLFAGGATGYALSAAALPGIATRRTPRVCAAVEPHARPAVVLLACTDPERYDPRAVALLGVELVHDGAIDIPLFTTPLVYLAQKARYRTFGGHSPGPGLARTVATAVTAALPGVGVHLAWTYDRPTLAEAVADLSACGAERVAIVVLGTVDSTPVERSLAAVHTDRADTALPALCVAPSLWLESPLTERLAGRILESIGNPRERPTGVVLVCAGQPPVAGTDRSGAAAEDTYFNQRVRMLLAEAGIEDARVRVAWIEWQQPDLTESVRHLAALGCTRIVVAPSTIALPTVSTSLDVRHALQTARLPEGVETTVLDVWGDDPVMVDAVVRSALEALRPV